MFGSYIDEYILFSPGTTAQDFTLKYKYTALCIEIQILELAVPKTGDRGEAEKKKKRRKKQEELGEEDV